MNKSYKIYIEKLTQETGYIDSTIEKVDRLVSILEWINNNAKLKDLLVLKGGTAINLAIFNLPRLSVDIDLDMAINVSRDEMLLEKTFIIDMINKYLDANGYEVNTQKSKKEYALDSIVATYQNVKGNKDNIKIEINYMLRTHILENKNLKISTDIFKNRDIYINCVNPIEIYASKICALLNRTTARDLFDIYTLSRYQLFDSSQKALLRKCFMFEYIAVCNYKLEDLKIEKIDELNMQDIRNKLLPTLKIRNPKLVEIDMMKKEVANYLKDVIFIDNTVLEFYNRFKERKYEPSILFEDKEILKRIENHPMVNWHLKNKRN